MKFIKTFENYEMDGSSKSREEMISHLCDCGYQESECDAMEMDELEMHYNKCGVGMAYEAKRNKKVSRKPKPDFLDLDKDGDKKESMKKASKDAKKDDKGDKKGLTAGQKRLPKALQDKILKGK